MKGKTSYGVYLIGWYGMDGERGMSDKDYYKKYVLEHKENAHRLSKEYIMNIEACVLDASL